MMRTLPAPYLRGSFVASGAKPGRRGRFREEKDFGVLLFPSLSLRSFFRLRRAKYSSFPDGAWGGGAGNLVGGYFYWGKKKRKKSKINQSKIKEKKKSKTNQSELKQSKNKNRKKKKKEGK